MNYQHQHETVDLRVKVPLLILFNELIFNFPYPIYFLLPLCIGYLYKVMRKYYNRSNFSTFLSYRLSL
jgi:hypothetical protein